MRVSGVSVLCMLFAGYSVAKAQRLNASVEPEDRDLQTVHDVVVIGAGWAGLAAARTLKSKGISNIRICEARDYIGGRSHTVPFDTSTFELGSQWIHGASNQNPMWNLAQQSPVPTIKTSDSEGAWSKAYGGSTPHRVPESQVTALWRQYKDDFFPFQRRRQDSTNRDESLQETLDLFVRQRSITGEDFRGLNWMVDTTIVDDYAASLQDLSMWWWDSDYAYSGGDAVLQQGTNKGYSGLVAYYAASLSSQIDLDCQVTGVDYRQSVVTIKYKQGGANKSYKARNVVVTVPLGVLQANTIAFTPTLPNKKRIAINKLGMGLLNKLIMRWDDGASLPWPSNVEWMGKIAADGQQGKWTEFFNEQAVTGRKIVIAFTAGREAERVEQLTETQATAEALASLKDMFGDSIPDPAEVLQTRWGQDPFSRGSYSYHKLGSRPTMRSILAQPVDGKLFFAGEATHSKYPSTTHGALLSGQAAASKIIMKYRRNRLEKRQLAAVGA